MHRAAPWRHASGISEKSTNVSASARPNTTLVNDPPIGQQVDRTPSTPMGALKQSNSVVTQAPVHPASAKRPSQQSNSSHRPPGGELLLLAVNVWCHHRWLERAVMQQQRGISAASKAQASFSAQRRSATDHVRASLMQPGAGCCRHVRLDSKAVKEQQRGRRNDKELSRKPRRPAPSCLHPSAAVRLGAHALPAHHVHCSLRAGAVRLGSAVLTVTQHSHGQCMCSCNVCCSQPTAPASSPHSRRAQLVCQPSPASHSSGHASIYMQETCNGSAPSGCRAELQEAEVRCRRGLVEGRQGAVMAAEAAKRPRQAPSHSWQALRLMQAHLSTAEVETRV